MEIGLFGRFFLLEHSLFSPAKPFVLASKFASFLSMDQDQMKTMPTSLVKINWPD
jgi:hypothetical protein